MLQEVFSWVSDVDCCGLNILSHEDSYAAIAIPSEYCSEFKDKVWSERVLGTVVGDAVFASVYLPDSSRPVPEFECAIEQLTTALTRLRAMGGNDLCRYGC